MRLTRADITYGATATVQPLGSSGGWHNSLPHFVRNIPVGAGVLDSAYSCRILAGQTVTLDNFPSVEKNGAPLHNDYGQIIAMQSVVMLCIRVSRVDASLPVTGAVTVVGDIMSPLDLAFTDNSDIIFHQAGGFTPISTTALTINATGATNLGVEMLILGVETAGVSS